MIKKEVIEFVLAHHQCREKQFSKLFNEFYLEIQQIKFPKEFSFRQKLYHWIHDDIDLKLGLCPVCENRCSFESLNAGYKHHCSELIPA
jgi:peptidyl-tRNA hydrolase